ncbi:MAG: hypothetical protein DRP79_07425, partial [Planctomycetota bacterium]
MKRIWRYILPLLILIPPEVAEAQYVGSSRPMPRAEMLDSLGTKADTATVKLLESRVAADSARLDSIFHGLKPFPDSLTVQGNVRVEDTLRVQGVLRVSGAYYLPPSDGSSGQVLKTDGAGNLSWQDDIEGGGGGDVVVAKLVIGKDGTSQENWTVDEAGGDSLQHFLDDALVQLSYGGTVFIKGGTYTVERAITLAQDTVIHGDIYIVGEPGRTVIRVNVGDGNYFLENAAN